MLIDLPRANAWLTRAAALGILAAMAMAPLPTMAAQALSGDKFRSDSGEITHLAGIHAPIQAATPEQAELARQELDKLIRIENPTVVYAPALPPRDRYGQISAQIYIGPPPPYKVLVWLQGKLLSEGLAFLDPESDGIAPSLLDDMIAMESEARNARRGIWNVPFYAGKPARELTGQDEGRYAFVRGTVVDAVRVKNKVYLNFGPDWRTDFTVLIAARHLKDFRNTGIDPLTLKGKSLHVRGWIKHNFGPMIEVTHPAQIVTLKDQE